MKWLIVLFFIVSYVCGAYILRHTTNPKDDLEYSGVTLCFIFSPVWVWFWLMNFLLEVGFKGIGRWISGK